jgi:hypothetical protein
VDKKLQMLHALENKGLPILNQSSANSLEMAKTFLTNYQTYTADSLFGELKSTLNNLEAKKNVTVISGNTKLEVTDNSEYKTTTFKWTYTFNGITAPSKFVALGFKNGLLSYFVDNWQFHNVGSTKMKLSKEEAIDIALKTAAAHSWSSKLDYDAFETKNFNSSNVVWTALIFDDSVKADEARSEGGLTLYPVWRVGIQLNRWYGNLYGIQVDVWADTKEVRCVQEAWSPMIPSTEETADQVSDVESLNGQASVVSEKALDSIILVPLSIFGAFSILSFAVLVNRKKLRAYHLPKLHAPRAYGIVLFVMLSLTVFVPIATVNATQTKGAVIWGSESSDATYPPPDDDKSWRKHETEIDLQKSLATQLKTMFASYGYDGAFNDQGDDGSYKDDILYRIGAMNEDFDSIVVIDFDHGVGRSDYYKAPAGEFHYMFEDQRGTIIGEPGDEGDEWEYQNATAVYDMDIYPLISEGKVSLAFINTCMSATVTDWINGDQLVSQGLLDDPPNQRAQGMPFAWTHRTVVDLDEPGFNIAENMSIDGYSDPDLGKQCYIGFSSGSASLMQQIPYDEGTHQYHEWVQKFFENIVVYGMSVNDALDDASEDLWGEHFGASYLRNFDAYWWMSYGSDPIPNCKMEVYGNGRIRPSHPFENILSIAAWTGGTTDPSPGDHYYDLDTTSVQVSAESYDHHAFDSWFLDKELYSHDPTINVQMNGNHELLASFKPQNKLEISAGEGGTTDPPPGTYWYDQGTQVSVTAEPSGSNDFDHWIIDGEYESDDNPITDELWSDTTLHAVFEGPPQPIPVTVIIDSVPYDGCSRYHGLTADNPMPERFWEGDWHDQNPDAIIAVTGSTLHYEKTFYLTEGYHNIEYAVSCYAGYWHATITAGG